MELQWKEEYSVGIHKIDEQHKGLFDLINKLAVAMKDGSDEKTVTLAVEKLLDYTKYHFTAEEYMMRQAAYADYEQHKKEHELFVAQAQDFFKQSIIGNPQLAMEITAFLTNWITSHIMHTDKKYQPFLAK